MNEYQIFEFDNNLFCCLKVISLGRYACLNGGSVILLEDSDLDSSYKLRPELKYIDMSVVRGFSVCHGGECSRKHTVDLLGQDSHSDLDKLIQAYGKSTSSLYSSFSFRVIHTKQETYCTISGDFIPTHFPRVMLSTEEVSLGFFYAHLRVLTNGFRDDNPLLNTMYKNGLTQHMVENLENTSLYYQWHLRRE